MPAPSSALIPARESISWRQLVLGGMLLLAACLIVYSPALRGQMLWDDNGHVTRADLQSLHGLWRIWFELGASQQYYPVLHSAFWFEHRLWGDAVLGYHLGNVVLHALAATLFVAALLRLQVRGAWIAGAIFALHPVCVESVAWISEQKNTLSTVFYLTAMLAYLRFDRRRLEVGRTVPGEPLAANEAKHGRSGRRLRLWYACALGLFVLAVLTKSVTATLPAALLVIFWWQRGRLSWKADALPLIPFFVLGAIAGSLTAWVEKALIGANGAAFELDAVERLLLAGRVVWFYLGKLLWPSNLIFVYPRWQIRSDDAVQYIGLLLAIAVVVALWLWRKRSRVPLTVVLLFGGSLFPALGFFNVFPFVYSFVADHFQYLASLGVIAGVCGGVTSWAGRHGSGRAVAGAVLAVVAVILGALSWRQAHEYRDNFVLYRSTLEKNPNAWMAAYNLGLDLVVAGKVDEAIPAFRQALRVHPQYAPAHVNLGYALLNRPGNEAEVVEHFEAAVRLNPSMWEPHLNLANVLSSDRSRWSDAQKHYEAAIRIDPTIVIAHYNYGVLLYKMGDRSAAIAEFEKAIRVDPTFTPARDVLIKIRGQR